MGTRCLMVRIGCCALFAVIVGMTPFNLRSDEPADENLEDLSVELQVYNRLLEQHKNMVFEELQATIPEEEYREGLSFDPTTATFFDRVASELHLNATEREIYQRQGMVSVDHAQRYSFGSMYYSIYARDLPVLITTDSIMHAVHCTYDDILKELETTLFTFTIDEVLSTCHEEVAAWAAQNEDAQLAEQYRDVDLYLTVARNLLAGAGAPVDGDGPPSAPRTGSLLVPSQLDQTDEAVAILELIQSLDLQQPYIDEPTSIYGGTRYVDYSQFRPRGHYMKTTQLKQYFRCMMWLGRADCGWNVSPVNPATGLNVDADRELRNSVLMVQLLAATGSVDRLRAVNEIIDFMVGRSDNLSVFAMLRLLDDRNVDSLADIASVEELVAVRDAIESGNYAQQRIRSQIIIVDPWATYSVPPPSIFQMFGQRYIIDSFVLSHVVYDSIIFNGRKQERMMPTGLDVAAALGNNDAVRLLEPDLREFNYSADLLACREYVDLHSPEFWKENLYNIWLSSLRTLDDDMSAHEHFPEAMQTRAWQRKQLQTQLGSWSELRHDTILYAKQSYTGVPSCEYPAGYVEPYPHFYANVKYFAEEASRLIAAADYSSSDEKRHQALQAIQTRQTEFLAKMGGVLGQLEALANKELAAQPFSEEEQEWLKMLIDRRLGSGPPQYDGWYCGLFYRGRFRASQYDPTIVDVHTDPDSETVLEVGVGDVNYCVVVIDNEDDRMTFVGPIYSYYEFRHPSDQRLTDEGWQQMIRSNQLPERPEWTEIFQGPRQERQSGRR